MTTTRATEPWPIQGQAISEGHRDRLPSSTVPLWLAAIAMRQYRKHYGRHHTLKSMGRRGGFGPIEFLDLLRGGNGLGNLVTETDRESIRQVLALAPEEEDTALRDLLRFAREPEGSE